MTEQARLESVRAIVRDDLEGHFKDEFVFDPIVVEPAIDEFGDGTGETYLRIVVVFNGDQNRLDPGWTSGLIRRIRPKLVRGPHQRVPESFFCRDIRVMTLVLRQLCRTVDDL